LERENELAMVEFERAKANPDHEMLYDHPTLPSTEDCRLLIRYESMVQRLIDRSERTLQQLKQQELAMQEWEDTREARWQKFASHPVMKRHLARMAAADAGEKSQNYQTNPLEADRNGAGPPNQTILRQVEPDRIANRSPSRKNPATDSSIERSRRRPLPEIPSPSGEGSDDRFPNWFPRLESR
jgi:hypothetical protein